MRKASSAVTRVRPPEAMVCNPATPVAVKGLYWIEMRSASSEKSRNINIQGFMTVGDSMR